MSTVSHERQFHETKEPYPIANDTPEWARLDDMHNGINDFLGNRLSFADIDFSPKKILEVGCVFTAAVFNVTAHILTNNLNDNPIDAGAGHGSAIQAANTYPNAEVIAVDISSLPPRPLPKNMSFRKVNVTEEVPFEKETFDIVHLRFVTIHVRNFRDVLAKLTALVRPGGWLLVEDIDHAMIGNTGPKIAKFYEIYHAFTTPNNVEPKAGPLLESVFKESGSFSEVNARKVNTPFSGVHEDPTIAHLGTVMKVSFSRGYKVLDPRLVEFGLTKEIQDGWYTEVNEPERKISCDIYFTWSRKSQ
ncbi:hypothetical protein M422DRAFT_240096 [Sphaerobolus stellatus SS14]|nr:hypothetical protein M422DRAFT_240096 [Sphaerobolus stellatus SS14]